MSNTLILNSKQIQQKINRIAYEIYENNYDEKELIIAGIASNRLLSAGRPAGMLYGPRSPKYGTD